VERVGQLRVPQWITWSDYTEAKCLYHGKETMADLLPLHAKNLPSLMSHVVQHLCQLNWAAEALHREVLINRLNGFSKLRPDPLPLSECEGN
jgi:hypothetical protein